MNWRNMIAATILTLSVGAFPVLCWRGASQAAQSASQPAAQNKKEPFISGHWHTPTYWEDKAACDVGKTEMPVYSNQKMQKASRGMQKAGKHLCGSVKLEDKMAKKCDDGDLKECDQYGHMLVKDGEVEGGIAVLKHTCDEGNQKACQHLQEAQGKRK